MGVERERSGHGDSGPDARFAGVRTFFMLGSLGGVAGWFMASGWAWGTASLVVALGALVTAAYLKSAGVDGTTEVAAILVVGLGMLAGTGELAIASGAGAVTVVALNEKATIHGTLQRIESAELRGALYFAVLALVILPVLPNQSYGPLGGLNPRSLWTVVLIFSGLNYLGYVARRIVGPSHGYAVAGALGGLISSTAVTMNFARRSRELPGVEAPLGIGVVAASTVQLPRVLVLSTILTPPVALALLPILLPAIVAGAALVGWWLSRSALARTDGPQPVSEGHSPLGVVSAIRLALVFQATLMGVEFVRTTFGATGIIASAALLGLTDTDALTLAMNRLGRDPSSTALAATAIGVGVLSNALVKGVLAAALGSPGFRRVALTGLATLALAMGAAVLVAGR